MFGSVDSIEDQILNSRYSNGKFRKSMAADLLTVLEPNTQTKLHSKHWKHHPGTAVTKAQLIRCGRHLVLTRFWRASALEQQRLQHN